MNYKFIIKNGIRKGAICGLLSVITSFSAQLHAITAHRNLLYLQQQPRVVDIRGTIFSNDDEPVVGATIQVKGKNIQAQSDAEGQFSLQIDQLGETLVISYVGYETQEIEVTTVEPLQIRLKPSGVLDEVVVVGYGVVKKRDLTGAVASVKSEEIMRTPTANVMDALQGKVSGMDIMKSSGRAGANVNVALRGSRSIYGDNNPLYIIDGIPGDFSRLNPSDIASIDVLKDASSTAIYGSAGSNGVVIITTKQGKAGKTVVDFDSYFGYNGFPKYPHGMTGDAYLNLKREAYRTQNGNYPEFLNNIFKNPAHLEAYEQGKWVDWVDQVLRDGIQQNYSLAVNGGTEKTNAYLSLNFNDEQGMIKIDRFKKYAVRTNVDHKISSVFKLGTNLQLTHTDNDQAAQNIFGNALTFLPLGDAFDAQGNIQHIPVDGVTNPLSDQIKDQYVNNTLNTYFSGNGFVDITPMEGLSFRSIFGAILGSSRTGRYFGTQSIANPEAGFRVPAAVIINDRNYDYRWENILTYAFDIQDDHHFTVTGVTSWAKNQAEQAYAGASGFDLDSYSFHNLSAGTNPIIRSSYIRSQSMSYVGRFNYNYQGKYLFSLSSRWDGVSRLSQGNQWDVFPAGAFAWRISDEKFFMPLQAAVSDLKLRVGYGITGNSGGVGAYGTQAGGFNAPRPVGFGDTPAPAFILNQQLANNALGWEKSYTTNIGLDASFLNQRINLTVDWYNADTKDLLYLRDMPASLGGSWGAPFKMWQNVGATVNRGLEILLTTKNIERDNFSWETTVTFAANRERIVTLPGNKDLISTGLFLGHPIKTFFDYKYLGIWQLEEEEEAARYNSLPGDIKLATDGTFREDGTHAYGANDKMILGSAVPDWTGGLQNNLRYKNWDASIFFTARWGQMVSSNLITRYNPTTADGNSPDDSDYWTPENPGAYLPRPGLHATASGYIGFESLKYVDGSYFKIRNITLGYTLPESIAKRAAMQRFRIYATANNGFIWTKSDLLKYQDPESNGSDNFPLTKQFVVGLNVTF
ncbi:SusC/RagA family TonB-linked outer membrane protein [Sphingobacterium deserti]|uniref:TonB-dependent receptor plug n=1 Tax=Sphingobacterium deserti TaxID=1229276 RepID=A0A0B8T8K5_9SPHI|nr:TonB-dependent receptor [Sphingobacterium deserti]KGE14989.1 TonB-dependent receptor plug [Sphingobacterium deserti]